MTESIADNLDIDLVPSPLLHLYVALIRKRKCLHTKETMTTKPEYQFRTGFCYTLLDTISSGFTPVTATNYSFAPHLLLLSLNDQNGIISQIVVKFSMKVQTLR